MISLKSIKGMALVTAALGAGLVLSTGSIHADTTDASSSSTFTSATSGSSAASGTTTANFSVTAGDGSTTTDGSGHTTTPNTDNGALQLTSAPSFNFGSINVATIVNGGTASSTSVTNNLSVKDYRGAATSTGSAPQWNVTASMSKFTDTTDTTNKNDLTATISGLSATSGTLVSEATIGSSATNVFSSSSNETKGIGTASATIKSAELTFSKGNSPVNNHSYSSTITWELSNTAASK